MLLGFCAYLLLTLQAHAGADGLKSAWRGPDQPVYVITKNHYREGLGAGDLAPHPGDLAAIEVFNPGAPSAEKKPPHKMRDGISLFRGGERHGRVKVERIAPPQCVSPAALFSAEAASQWPEDGMALATNSRSVRAHPNSQRPADSLERWHARNLAMLEFRKHGVPQELANNVTMDRLVVTTLGGSQDLYLIGFLFVEYQKAGHTVFLIAKLGSPGATAELVRYHLRRDLADASDVEKVRFVDQLDMDNDGKDEIVVQVTGYAGEEFLIYKRFNGTWSVVHASGQGGC